MWNSDCTHEYISGTENSYLKEIPRKKMPVYTGVIKYFPNAIKYVSMVSQAGNDQHHADKPLHWDKNKSSDHTDALARHLLDHSYEPMDDDGMLHLGKVAWRALAALEIYLENEGDNI
ncbi:MAG: dATP/dGTP diphosphohydrolase domain-containing protein [Methylophilaceae bacterium]